MSKYFVFLISLLISVGLLLLITTPLKNVLDNCEDRSWDGSTFDTGIKEVTLFKKPETIKVKCNKDSNGETDAMIGIIDSLYFWEDQQDE